MSKVYMMAYRGFLVGIMTNKKIVWEKLLELYGVTEEEIKSGERRLTLSYYNNWRNKEEPAKTYEKATYNCMVRTFRMKQDIVIRDSDYYDEKVTIQERFLNELDETIF